MEQFHNAPFEKRLEECVRIRKKYPDRIPVIIERKNTKLADIDRHKFIIASDFTMAQLLYTIRKRLTLKPDQALFLMVNDTLPKSGELLSAVYKEHKGKDGFLYVKYDIESTFG